MKLPKQELKIDEDRQALAPYNFVELPERIAAVIEGDKLPKVKDEMSSQEREAVLQQRNALVTAQLPDQNIFHAERYSGWIDCRLITASPSFVRGPLTPEQVNRRMQSKDLPAFFYEWDENEPVIPGSTLRGMLRMLVEIASFSKITEVTSKRLIYRAVGDTTRHGEKYREQLMADETEKYARGNRNQKYQRPLMRGGYLRKRGSDWRIQPAEERDGTTFARIRIDERFFDRLAPVPGCRNAFKVYVRVGPYDFQPVRGGFLNVRAARVLDSSDKPTPGLFEATLARSGHMFSKRSEAVIYPEDRRAEPLPLDDDQIDDYRNQISQEQEKLLGKGGVLKEGQPVFYILVGDENGNPAKDKNGKLQVNFFGHCRMLRLPYKQSPKDFVPSDLRQRDDKDDKQEDIDLAEAIFGFTKSLDDQRYCNKERRYAGRVSVSAARLVPNQEDIWLSPNRPIIPRILGTPKPTTFQHYLVQTQPNAKKSGQTKDGRPKFEVSLADYAAPTLGGTVIRGHKLYWHKGEVKQEEIELRERGKENVTTQIQPVRAGVQFEFRIQFENLSDVELGAMLRCLQIGADDSHRLKMGMGKPLGMGAVKTIPTLRLIDRADRYTTLFDGENWALGLMPEDKAKQNEQAAVSAFEKFVVDMIQPGATHLSELERIRQLLAILQWPGPNPEFTRYLEIERYDPTVRRGKRNEYDGRPVLPHPFAVAGMKETQDQLTVLDRSALPDSLPAGFQWGTVMKWGLGSSASYGFIQPDGGGQQVFAHLSVLPSGRTELEVGERVMFVSRKEARGPVATEIRTLHSVTSKSETRPPSPSATKPTINKTAAAEDKNLKYGNVKVWGLGAKKAYGLIRPDENSDDQRDVFVYISNLIEVSELKPGNRVQYRLRQREFGMEAIEVQVISSESEGSDES